MSAKKRIDRIQVLEDALAECIDTLASGVEPLPREDPAFGAEVRELGDCIGYGAMMSSASASWRRKLARDYPGTEGGEHSHGSCVAVVQAALKRAREALAKPRRKR